jgi:hypothetical protein
MAGPLTAQEGRAWRPEDRTVLTSFHLVSGMARDDRQLYAASEGGLQILDLLSGRWEQPSTMEDGYPVEEGPAALAYDPFERVVWLGTAAGGLHTYQVDFGRWRLEASPGLGPIVAIFPLSGERGNGVLARTPTGWYVVERFSGAVQPLPPGQLPAQAAALEVPAHERLRRLEPAYAASGATLTADRGGRTWPVTSFVAADRPGVYWLGTAGNNLYRFDVRFLEAEPRPFGLLTPGSGALALGGGWLWMGGDGRGPRRGPVRASQDLQQWHQYEAGIVAAPSELVEDIAVTEDAVWFGGRGGLYRLDRPSDRWSQVGGIGGRLPVRRLALADGGLWVATDRGLTRVSADGTVGDTFFEGRAVHAAVAANGGIWVGGAGSLVHMLEDGRVAAPVPGAPPAPPGPVVDLVSDRGDTWAATPDALWRFDGRGWEGPLREVPTNVGRLRRLRLTGDALWVTGDAGAARRVRDESGWRYLLVGRDLPAGPALDVLVTEDRVYVSTPAGVVRLQRRRGY